MLKLHFFVEGVKKNDGTFANSVTDFPPGDTSGSGDVSWPLPGEAVLALTRWRFAERFSWVAGVRSSLMCYWACLPSPACRGDRLIGRSLADASLYRAG